MATRKKKTDYTAPSREAEQTPEVNETPVAAEPTAEPVEEKPAEPAKAEVKKEAPKKVSKVGVVTGCGMLNIRRIPSTDGGVVGQARKDSVLSILGTDGEFFKVKTSTGTEGYAMTKYIAVK